MMRTPKRDVEILDQVIPAGKLVLPIIGSANRDPQQFREAGRFDITRNPNPHVAFGHGIHFCLGAPLSRLEARIALTDILQKLKGFKLASDEPWKPRAALRAGSDAIAAFFSRRTVRVSSVPIRSRRIPALPYGRGSESTY